MLAIRYFLRALNVDERGATAIEYGLIASLIAISLIASLSAVGTAVMAWWDKVNAAL